MTDVRLGDVKKVRKAMWITLYMQYISLVTTTSVISYRKGKISQVV